jgi:hypothetical protein
MQKQFYFAHACRHFFSRWWNEGGITGAGAADPVLGSAKFAGRLL